jgi:hypothetical protein
MKRTLKFIVIVAIALLPLAANAVEDSPVDNKSTYHIGENIDLVSAHDIQYEKPKIMVKMVFPRLSSSIETVKPTTDKTNQDDVITGSNNETPTEATDDIIINAFNEAVTKIINEEVVSFKQRVADAQDYQKTLEKSKVKNRLTIDYNSAIINLDEAPIISIRFIIQGYMTGMAHPFHQYRVLNFDLASGTVIQLSDLFQPGSNYLEIFTQYANNALSKKLRGEAASNVKLSEMNFANWNINISGLRITFDEATVAPYVYGAQEVLIPYSALKEDLLPDSVLGRCLAHRKRCMQDPLLTGGFIDEAANTKHGRLNPVLG